MPTVVDDLNSGVCDIAAVPINGHLNLFPYSNLITYTPFLGLPGMLETADLFTEMHNEQEAISKEYTNAGLHYWTNYPMPGYNIYTTNKKNEIRTPRRSERSEADLQFSPHAGVHHRPSGCRCNRAPVTEYATSLNTNVVDGIINHINVLAALAVWISSRLLPCSVIPVRLRLRWSWPFQKKFGRSCRPTYRNFLMMRQKS